jgi:hypothetical protein
VGLVINDASTDGLTVIDGASADISDASIWENVGGVFVNNGHLRITDSSIRFNVDYGFKIYGNPGAHSVNISSCAVENNIVYGFLLGLQARPVVNGCAISLNGPDADRSNVEFFPGYSNEDDIDMTGNWWGVYTEFEIRAMIEPSTCTVDISGWLDDRPVPQ